MGVMFWWAAPIDCGEIPFNPPMGGGYSSGDSLVDEDSSRDISVGMWSGVNCLLEEWKPSLNWGRMGTLEGVELAFCNTGNSLGKLSGHKVAGKVRWQFLMALVMVTKERDTHFSSQ